MATTHTRAKIFWFSGLSGSGKTTWAEYVQRYLRAQGLQVCLLDGDTLRKGLNCDLGYSQQDRKENIRRACEMALYLHNNNITVVAAFMTPTAAARHVLQALLPADSLREIYCKCSINACEKRDPKGFYRRARQDATQHVIGWDTPFCPPERPALTLDTEHQTMLQNQAILRQFLARNYAAVPALDPLTTWP